MANVQYQWLINNLILDTVMQTMLLIICGAFIVYLLQCSILLYMYTH